MKTPIIWDGIIVGWRIYVTGGTRIDFNDMNGFDTRL